MSPEPTIAVTLQRDFRAPVAKVFAAWSNPAFITTWWRNLTVAHIDFREGGTYEFRWESWEGRVVGSYREIVDNQRIVFTWCPEPRSEGCGDSVVTIEFEQRGNVTRLVLTHDLNRNEAEADDHVGGWTGALNDLALEYPAMDDPVAAYSDGRQPSAAPA